MSENDPRHGTTAGYHAGCRLMCCRRAIARYEKAGRLARLNGGLAVPAIGAQRRLQALMVLGWSSHRIAAEAGLPHRNHVWRIINGQKGKPTTWIQRSTDEWVKAVYERLSMEIPTGRYVVRTRNYAAAQEWAPPLAWDDIDDPDEAPHSWHYRPATRDEMLSDLVDKGAGITEACRVLKLSRSSLEKWAERSGRLSDFRTLTSRETRIVERRNQFSGGAA